MYLKRTSSRWLEEILNNDPDLFTSNIYNSIFKVSENERFSFRSFANYFKSLLLIHARIVLTMAFLLL